MQVDVNSSWTEIQHEIGKALVHVGETLKDEQPFTYADFTKVISGLRLHARSVETIRDSLFPEGP